MPRSTPPAPAPYHRLLVFVPEGDRTSKAVPVDLQDKWVIRLLSLFAELFGGATSYGRGVGVWRDGRGRTHWDRVTVLEAWVDPTRPNLPRRFDRMGRALIKMGGALNQEVVGCIVDGEWWSYTKKGKA